MKKTLVPLFFLISIIFPIVRSDLVADICKNSPLPKVCIAVLRADPRSKTADIAGLALIVVNAIEVKSQSTLEEIRKLIESRPSLKGPLRKCAAYYDAILRADIPQSKEALIKGIPKFAEAGVTDAGNEARYCEECFAPLQSPLTMSNKSIQDLSVVGEAIIKMLL